MKKLMSTIFNLFLIVVIVVSAVYIVSAAQTQKDPGHLPSVMGFIPLTVVSGSMSPGIQTGDLVIVKEGNRDIREGDVVTYRLQDFLVTHRVKEIEEQNTVEVFITQGDANRIPDYKTVDRSQILGKYVFRIPMGGYIRALLQGPFGILLMTGLVWIAIMGKILEMSAAKLKEAEENMKHEDGFAEGLWL
jgi:signal peptidase